MATHWIWQQPDWPDFNWQAERLTALLRECVQAQGQLMGMAGSVGNSLSAQTELDALLQNIVTSSAIEGEQLDVESVRSSLARRLGLESPDGDNVSKRSEGLAQLMLDGRQGGPHGDLGLTVPVATVAAVVRVALGAGVDMQCLPGGIDSVSEDQVVSHVYRLVDDAHAD